MSFVYCLPVLLLAVLYRIVRASQKNSWQSNGFNSAVIALCLATSATTFRQQLDSLLHVPNIANLLSHFFLIIASVGAMSYLDYLVEGRPSPRQDRVVRVATILLAVKLLLWSLARPLHGAESITDLIYVRDPLVVLYSSVFYAYLVGVTFRVGLGCLAQVTHRSWRRSASLGAIGIGALAAAPLTGSWLLTTLWPNSIPRPLVYALHTTGTLGLTVIGLGVLMLALPAAWWRAGRSVVLLAEVFPLWRLIRRRYPIVALPLGTAKPTFLAQRAIIEIQDGLALGRFDLPSNASMSDLARSLRCDRAGTDSARSLLAGGSSEWQAIAQLARCYWCASIRGRLAFSGAATTSRKVQLLP